MTEEVAEPTIEHSSDTHAFQLIKEIPIEGPLEDFALSPDRTLLVSKVGVYDEERDSFDSSLLILNLTDFSEIKASLNYEVDYVAVQNSGSVLTTSSNSVRKMLREWDVTESPPR